MGEVSRGGNLLLEFVDGACEALSVGCEVLGRWRRCVEEDAGFSQRG